MQPRIFAKYRLAVQERLSSSKKHDTDFPHFKLLKIKKKHTLALS